MLAAALLFRGERRTNVVSDCLYSVERRADEAGTVMEQSECNAVQVDWRSAIRDWLGSLRGPGHEMLEATVFGIRFFTPQALGSDLQPIAGGVLRVGDTLLRFPVDLSYWGKANYERQWHDAIQLLARGAQRAALVYAYRGTDQSATHLMFAMWRDDQFVYVQDQAVLASELDAPFDPKLAHIHVGERLTPDSGAGIPEWRFEIEHLLAVAFGMRSPG